MTALPSFSALEKLCVKVMGPELAAISLKNESHYAGILPSVFSVILLPLKAYDVEPMPVVQQRHREIAFLLRIHIQTLRRAAELRDALSSAQAILAHVPADVKAQAQRAVLHALATKEADHE